MRADVEKMCSALLQLLPLQDEREAISIQGMTYVSNCVVRCTSCHASAARAFHLMVQRPRSAIISARQAKADAADQSKQQQLLLHHQEQRQRQQNENPQLQQLQALLQKQQQHMSSSLSLQLTLIPSQTTIHASQRQRPPPAPPPG